MSRNARGWRVRHEGDEREYFVGPKLDDLIDAIVYEYGAVKALPLKKRPTIIIEPESVPRDIEDIGQEFEGW